MCIKFFGGHLLEIKSIENPYLDEQNDGRSCLLNSPRHSNQGFVAVVV